MKRLLTLLLIISILLLSACGKSTSEKAKTVLDEMSSTLTQCKNQESIPVRGKVIVWDSTTNKMHAAYDRIPENLRWTGDGPVTVVSIVRYNDEKVGTYGKGTIGYRSTAELAVGYYPEKRPGGIVSIRGNNPPQEIRYKHSPPPFVRGDLSQPIADWVNMSIR